MDRVRERASFKNAFVSLAREWAESAAQMDATEGRAGGVAGPFECHDHFPL